MPEQTTPTPAKVNTSNWPESLEVTRNEVTMVFKKSPRNREVKDSLNLPFYTYDVASVGLEQHIKFIGEKIASAHLQAKLDAVSQFIQKDLTSQDGTRIDDETLVKNLTEFTGRTEGIKILTEQLAQILRDFASNPPKTQEEMMKRGQMMAEIQAKIDAKRRSNDEDDES